MGNLTDRAAYLRGLAEGMGLDKEKKEHKLLLEMLGLMDEMAQKVSDLDADVGELEEYVEDLDSDLSDWKRFSLAMMRMSATATRRTAVPATRRKNCPSTARTAAKPFWSRLPTSTMMKAPCANSAASPSSWMRRMTARTSDGLA